MFCSGSYSLIIIYLVLGLLLISSDFSKLGGHLKRLIYLASDRGLPSRYLPISLVSFYLTVAPVPVSGWYIFCGPIHQLTLSGVSPAVCPWMHGLSSLFIKADLFDDKFSNFNLSLWSAIIRLLYSVSIIPQKFLD